MMNTWRIQYRVMHQTHWFKDKGMSSSDHLIEQRTLQNSDLGIAAHVLYARGLGGLSYHPPGKLAICFYRFPLSSGFEYKYKNGPTLISNCNVCVSIYNTKSTSAKAVALILQINS